MTDLQLSTLPRCVRDDQGIAKGAAQETLQLAKRDLLWLKPALELGLHLLQTRPAVQHFQNGVLFFLETVVPKRDRILQHDLLATQEPIAVHFQVRAQAQRELMAAGGIKRGAKFGHRQRSC